MDTGGGWGGDRAPLFDRRELDRVPLTRTSTTQPVGTVHTTHSNQNDPGQTRDPRQPGNGARGTEGTGRGESYETQDGGAGIGGPRSWSDARGYRTSNGDLPHRDPRAPIPRRTLLTSGSAGPRGCAGRRRDPYRRRGRGRSPGTCARAPERAATCRAARARSCRRGRTRSARPSTRKADARG